ncbi:MAG: hypothetical protein KAT32_03910 [Candidatus Moranbacteria bacterium]|nr:hypothetical protein [Candidatus Moranbacteria bacterium]
MSITEEKKLEILYDHYKDTSLNVKEYIKQRDKIFVFLIIVIFILFLQLSFSNQSLSALNKFIENKIGFNFYFSEEFFNGVLWFILFSFLLRYSQINVLINRQYDYLHSVEDCICIKASKKNYIRREGHEYLKNYPFLSEWAHIVYTWIFPILLIFILFIKIVMEIKITKKHGISIYFDGIIFLLIFLTVVLYLVNIHRKR